MALKRNALFKLNTKEVEEINTKADAKYSHKMDIPHYTPPIRR